MTTGQESCQGAIKWKILTTQDWKTFEIPEVKEEILFNTQSIYRYPQRVCIGSRTKLTQGKKGYFKIHPNQL